MWSSSPKLLPFKNQYIKQKKSNLLSNVIKFGKQSQKQSIFTYKNIPRRQDFTLISGFLCKYSSIYLWGLLWYDLFETPHFQIPKSSSIFYQEHLKISSHPPATIFIVISTKLIQTWIKGKKWTIITKPNIVLLLNPYESRGTSHKSEIPDPSFSPTNYWRRLVRGAWYLIEMRE